MAMMRTKRTLGSLVVLTIFLALNKAEVFAQANKLKAVEVVKNINFPVAFTFSQDGKRIWFGENASGKIKIFHQDNSSVTDFFQIPETTAVGEGGLLGLALHPEQAKFVYVYVTRVVGKKGKGKRKKVIRENQVWRIENNNGIAGNFTIILKSPKNPRVYHDGGRMLFNKTDGKLFVVIGESHQSTNAQNLKRVTGKLLRMNDDGTVPSDNPIPNSLIYAYGIRNSVGFTFDPVVPNHIWLTENGPECNDEVNLLTTPLTNFGWGPKASCNAGNTNRDGPNITLPAFNYKIPPSLVGIAICRGCNLTNGEGHLFVGSWNEGTIKMLEVNAQRTKIVNDPLKFTNKIRNGEDGPRVISLEIDPSTNKIYFSDTGSIYLLENL